MNDLDIIDAGVKSNFDFGSNYLIPHFIYCGVHYFNKNNVLVKWLREKMSKYGIQSSILTMLHFIRWNLITKEKAKSASKGKLKNEKSWKNEELSVNDDFETILTNLQNAEEIEEEVVHSFLTPKLTNEELKLVERENQEHLNTYFYHCAGRNPDVSAEEMKKTDSKSKYVHVGCGRVTFHLNLDQ